MNKIAIEAASLEQLRAFCEMQNLPYTQKHNTPSLRSLIETAGFTEISLPAEEAQRVDVVYSSPQPSVDWADPAQVDPLLKPYLRVELMIHPKEGDKHPVPVDVDGRTMVIPRGVKGEVPYKYYEALCHAQQMIYPESDMVTEQALTGGSLVHSYPFQVFRIFEDTDPERRRMIDGQVKQMKDIDAKNVVVMNKALDAAIQRGAR